MVRRYELLFLIVERFKFLLVPFFFFFIEILTEEKTIYDRMIHPLMLTHDALLYTREVGSWKYWENASKQQTMCGYIAQNIARTVTSPKDSSV